MTATRQDSPFATGSGGGRLAPVDGLRGLAILLVLLAHVHQAVGYPYIADPAVFASVDFARSGVDLFFVLSGFCLYYPLTKPGAKPRWRTFFWRRARRLLPPYYAALALVVFAPLAIRPAAARLGALVVSSSPPDWHQVWTHLTMTHPFFADAFYGLDSPLWSLGVEWQFYLAFPLAVWLVARLEWRGVALVGCATLAYRQLVMVAPAPVPSIPFDIAEIFPSRWLEFVMGMLVAMQLRRAGTGGVPRYREAFDLAGTCAVFVVASYYLYGPLENAPYAHKDLLFSVCWAMVVYLTCREGSVVSAVFSWRPLVWLGTISYSVYLLHFPIIFALAPPVNALHAESYAQLMILAAISLPAVIGCSAVFYHYVERPFLNTAPAAPSQRALSSSPASEEDARERAEQSMPHSDFVGEPVPSRSMARRSGAWPTPSGSRGRAR